MLQDSHSAGRIRSETGLMVWCVWSCGLLSVLLVNLCVSAPVGVFIFQMCVSQVCPVSKLTP
jgi:hypothetical protein